MQVKEHGFINNKIIRRNIISMTPASFIFAVVLHFVFMIDMLIAGCIIGKTAIAVVAIGLPCYGMFLALPFLMKLYGMAGNPDIRLGTIFQLGFLVFFFVIFVMTVFYEATQRFGMSLFAACIPDSVVYPLLLFVLAPRFHKLGIWYAQSFSSVVGLLICYVLLVIIVRKFPLPIDKLLLLKKQIVHRSPMIDISVSNTDEDAVGASEYIQDFLVKSGVNPKTSYVTALCSEELAADMTAHFKAHPVKSHMDNAILDIKVFDDGDSMEIIIRSMGTPYNPLDFSVDSESFSKIGVKLAQKATEKINYTNVYKMNIISIIVKK